MLIDMPATRDAWLALRQKRIGASEVAALFGVQAPYQLSHYALWHVKAGRAPAPMVDGPRVRWGQRLEEVVALAAAEERGWTVTRGRYAICDDCDGLGASLDFEIAGDPTGEHPGPGVLETKNVDWMVHRQSWTDDEPPPHILLQLQAQLAATGYAWGAIAGLVGGNDLRIHVYPARPVLIAEIKSRVAAFWQSIAENRAPPVDGTQSTAQVLRALYPEVVDDAVDMSHSNEWPVACADFLRAAAEKRTAETAYEQARNRLAELLGPHQRGFGNGYTVRVQVTPARPDRPAEPGEIIKGRVEMRRYNVRMQENA